MSCTLVGDIIILLESFITSYVWGPRSTPSFQVTFNFPPLYHQHCNPPHTRGRHMFRTDDRNHQTQSRYLSARVVNSCSSRFGGAEFESRPEGNLMCLEILNANWVPDFFFFTFLFQVDVKISNHY